MSGGVTKVYRDAAAKEQRQALVVENLPFVRHVLGKIVGRLPSTVDVDNLESAGVLGLVEASHQFDPDTGVSFRAFAYRRVHGAIIDELRRNSPLPQRLMTQIAQVRKAQQKIEPPHTVERLSECTGLSLSEVNDCLNAMRLSQPNPLYGESLNTLRDLRTPSVGLRVEREEEKRQLADQIEKLPEQQRTVLTLYYSEDLRLKEIGRVLNLSESRISRILSQAERNLRDALNT